METLHDRRYSGWSRLMDWQGNGVNDEDVRMILLVCMIRLGRSQPDRGTGVEFPCPPPPPPPSSPPNSGSVVVPAPGE